MNKVKYILINSKYLRWLQFFTNWFFQGIIHADKSEKLYKILFTIFFWIVLFTIFFLVFNLHFFKSILFGFLISHTLNWFVNNNLFVLLVHRIKWMETTKSKLFNQLFSIQNRLEKLSNKDWILYSVSHGGICNGTLNNHSDIDVSLIRKPGVKNMAYAILFYVKEKKYADFKGVPLDIFICDTPENCIKRSKYQKNPIVILDLDKKVNNFYTDKLSISIKEAMILNGETSFDN